MSSITDNHENLAHQETITFLLAPIMMRFPQAHLSIPLDLPLSESNQEEVERWNYRLRKRADGYIIIIIISSIIIKK